MCRNSKNPTQKHRYKALCFEHLSHSHSSWDLQTYGGLTRKTTPRADEHGTRSFRRWIPIFFSRKMMRPTLFFFSGCEGLPRDGKAKGQTRRTRRRGSGPRRGSARRGMFSIGFSFRAFGVVKRGRRGWGMEPISARIFFFLFSPRFWVDVAVKNEMTDIVTLSLSQSSAAACAPTNTRSSVNTTS